MKNSDIRVGLLAYGAIGHEHNLAVQNTSGLELSAVCDTNPDRVAAALALAPGATAFNDATEMLNSGSLPHQIAIFNGQRTHCHAEFTSYLKNRWRLPLTSATS
jgi:predicted dehydrogenase